MSLSPFKNINLAYEKSQQMQGRSVEDSKNLRINYILTHIFSQMIPSNFFQKGGRNGGFSGKIATYEFEVKASPIGPNNGMVGMVKLKNLQNGQENSFVIKPEPKSEEFLKDQKENSIKLKYTPEILTTFIANNEIWLVCEELTGYHNTELVENLGTNLDIEIYAQNVAKLVLECAENNLKIEDTAFQDGHNVFATNKEVKLVEQGNLLKEISLKSNEIATNVVLGEMEKINHTWNAKEYVEGKLVSSYKLEEAEIKTKFVFSLLQNILPELTLESMYIRAVRVPMTSFSKDKLFHTIQNYKITREENLKSFELLWNNLNNPDSLLKQRLDSFLQKIRNISDIKELARLYQTPEGKEFLLYSQQRLESRRFPKEVYDLVIANDYKGFKKICIEKTFVNQITDVADPAYYGYLYEPPITKEEKNKEIVFITDSSWLFL